MVVGLQVVPQRASGHDAELLCGVDRVTGGALRDVLYGGLGNDTLTGGGGDDLLDGEEGTDTLNGGIGNDEFDLGRYGSLEDFKGDQINGEGGFDRVDFGGASVGVVVDLANQANNDGAALNDRFTGIEHVTGSYYDDLLVGNGGANSFDGGLRDDVIKAGGGNDVLEGGGGADELWGNAGADEFILERDDAYLDHQSYWPHDSIRDFTKSQADRLVVLKSEFGVTSATFKLNSNTTGQATSSGATFVFETDVRGGGRLWFDRDGKGVDTDRDGSIDQNEDSILVATLNGITSLAKTDFSFFDF